MPKESHQKVIVSLLDTQVSYSIYLHSIANFFFTENDAQMWMAIQGERYQNHHDYTTNESPDMRYCFATIVVLARQGRIMRGSSLYVGE